MMAAAATELWPGRDARRRSRGRRCLFFV